MARLASQVARDAVEQALQRTAKLVSNGTAPYRALWEDGGSTTTSGEMMHRADDDDRESAMVIQRTFKQHTFVLAAGTEPSDAPWRGLTTCHVRRSRRGRSSASSDPRSFLVRAVLRPIGGRSPPRLRIDAHSSEACMLCSRAKVTGSDSRFSQ